MTNKGLLVVISGPAGVGKGTVIRYLIDNYDDYTYSVSATTRKPRPGETEGKSYFYITRDEFKDRIENGLMLEYAEYVDNFYGTPRTFVEEKLNAGCNVILEIETRGALQVKERMPEAVMIFVCPPSITELEHRLRGRATETEEVIAKRMTKARSELALAGKYDYVLVNNNNASEETAKQIQSIVFAEKHSVSRGMVKLNFDN